jgi:hypothetical protein
VPRRTIRIAALGLDATHRKRLVARVCEAATRGGGAPAELLPLARELEQRGLHREDDDAPPGGRTTRQAIDAVLSTDAPPSPDRESFYVSVGHTRLGRGGALVELVDVSGERFRNDSGHGDALHPFRELEREARALIVSLSAEAWSSPDGVGATELDRTAGVLRAFCAARPVGAPPLSVALVATGAEAVAPDRRAEPGRWPAFEELLGKLPTKRLQVSVWAVEGPPLRSGDSGERDPRTADPYAEIAGWLIRRTVAAPGRRWPRIAVRALVAALVLAGGVFGWAALDMHAIRGEPMALSAAQEQAFIADALQDVAFWERLPGARRGGPLRRVLGITRARAAVREHARHLDDALRAHPAVAEPYAAIELAPPQYRTAAEGLALAGRVLAEHAADTEEVTRGRKRLIERLRQKARVAEMPGATADTLPAWRELLATCPDQTLREQVVMPRVRGVVASLVAGAERAAAASPAYPELFAPLLALEERYGELAPERIAQAKDKLWELGWQSVAESVEPLPPLARARMLAEALARAPAPPPDGFRQRAGLALGPALHEAAVEGGDVAPLADPLARYLGPAGASALMAALAPRYQVAIRQDAASGPQHVEALRQVVAVVPQALLPKPDAARVEALRAHLGDLTREGRYAVRVERAWVHAGFDSVFDGFDLVITFENARSGNRSLGPRANTRDATFDDLLYGDGELRWKPWDGIVVRVHDDRRAVGVRYVDEGSPFGLHNLTAAWKDERDRGGFTLKIEPSPPVWFDFTGWPKS